MIIPFPRIWLAPLLALTLLAPAGCHPRDGRQDVRQRELMHTSFEEFEGWSPQTIVGLTTEKAHSGKFALRVDPEHEYSSAYRAELGLLCSHRPRRFTVGAWVWIPSFQDDAKIVVSIANPDNLNAPVFYQYMYLTDSESFEQWHYVTQDFDLPTNVYLTSKSQLVIYLWESRAKQPVYADDLQLTELW